MKHGFRKPSFRKSIAARTVGRAKRQLMKELIPGYGTKGMGVVHPIRSAYNKLYHDTTFGINDLSKGDKSTIITSNSYYNSGLKKIIDTNASRISKELEKLNKKCDSGFFQYLEYLYQSIDLLKKTEDECKIDHSRSIELYNYLKNNEEGFIKDYFERYYNKCLTRISNLKTYNAKINVIMEYNFIIDYNKELLSDENTKLAREFLNKLNDLTK